MRAVVISNKLQSKEDHVRFWVDDSMRNIVPPGTEHPAGWDECAFLRRLTGLLDFSTMYELGCGYGRLCTAFRPEAYLGIDINPKAVEKARKDNAEYTFRVIDFDGPYPERDLCLAYTVLLHVDDRYVGEVVEQISGTVNRLLIAEILGQHWRGKGDRVPVFSREKEDYVRLFSRFSLDMEVRKAYRHYPDTDISFLYFIKQ